MTAECEQTGLRVLINAPFGRDAESMALLLRDRGYEAQVCPDLPTVADALDDAIGLVLLTEEALLGDVDRLKEALAGQPSWSDVPFVLLASPRAGRMPNAELSRLRLFDLATNSVVLERPLGRASLFSAVASAMRMRQRQFQMRDRLNELNESGTRLRLATSAANIGTWDYDPVTGALTWDERCKAMFGIRSQAFVSFEHSFAAGVHPDDQARTAAAIDAALDPRGSGEFNVEYRTIGIEDGIERWIAARGGAIFAEGRAVRFIGTVIDITERKKTEAALAASEAALRAERLELDLLTRTLEDRVVQRTAELEQEMAGRSRAEEALRQAQKMEAVGQLTGGIAHDFNNMLTGIIGGVSIVKRRIAAGRVEDIDRFMDAVTESANRAAALVARLLAFSRRQTLDARPVDVNALLVSLEDLLRRTLPEGIAIDIATDASAGSVVADPNQLESAILNLAINSRDAMPDGGRLRLETGRVTVGDTEARSKPGLRAGRYVIVSVADSGVGMPPEILERVFEPFFTTKPIGQGTGLGLSMIYGFARQSGGYVAIQSHPGEGTRIDLYLPATDATPDAQAAVANGAMEEGEGQTVLVVEDDEWVRLLICEVLADLSYRVLKAGEPEAAIAILSSPGPVDLMVSDVGLPGMNGRQLAEIARQHRPELPILFVTGYAENAATKASFLGTNMAMISKPFAVEALAAKINEMIS